MLQIHQCSDCGDSDPDESATAHPKPRDDGKTSAAIALKSICTAPEVTPMDFDDKDIDLHEMEMLGLDLDDESSPADQKQANYKEARKLSIQRSILSLVHACQCRDANCRLPSCQKKKRVVQHTKICKRKANGDCPICKPVMISCKHFHAKYCQEIECPVPFCQNIKIKMKQQQLQARLQQAQLLRRHFSLGEIECPVPFCQNIKIKMKQQQLQARLQQAQLLRRHFSLEKEAARQQAPHAAVGYVGKVPQVKPPPQMQRGLASGPGPSSTPLLSMYQWQQNRYQSTNMGNAELSQPTPQLMPQNQPGAQGPIAGAIHLSQPIPSPQNKQALKQLLDILRSPNILEKQQQILQILKSNPQLMAAFIKQRHVFQQMYKQQQQQQQQQQQNDVNVNVPQAPAIAAAHLEPAADQAAHANASAEPADGIAIAQLVQLVQQVLAIQQ